MKKNLLTALNLFCGAMNFYFAFHGANLFHSLASLFVGAFNVSVAALCFYFWEEDK